MALFHRWLTLRGVGRHPAQQRVGARGARQEAPASDADRLHRAASLPIAQLLVELNTRAEGLSAREVAARLRRFGRNELPREPAWTRWLQPVRSAVSPFNVLLGSLAALAWIANDARAAAVIGVMVVLSSVLRLMQEGRAHRALERLQLMVCSTATVVRTPSGHPATAVPSPIEVPMSGLVPGDIVMLAAGERVPADCRLIDSRELFVAQASLTGESLPVEKDAKRFGTPEAGLFTEPALVLMGTTVVSGGAKAVVLATGASTLFGSIALSTVVQTPAGNSLQQQMNRVGLPTSEVLRGPDIDTLDDAALDRLLARTRVAARLTPQQKERIAQALKRAGCSVGFLGDGINDAPALRAADVGISVDSAVDVAREAADVVLLQKSLLVIDAGVMQGRAALCNMNRYLRMAASSNFGNVLSVLVASVFLPFLPMLPLQLLVQNLLYDLSQAALPFDRVESELIAAPLRWEPTELTRFMLVSGPVSSLFDVLAFVVLTRFLHVGTVEQQAHFQSAWLMLGLATQVLVVQLIRAPELPLMRQRASWPVTLASLSVLAVGIGLPFSPLAPVLGLAPPPTAWFAWLLLLLGGYLLLMVRVRHRLVARPHHGY
ncbi:MAG: HAD-IC family P-type ATPase [Betaproteobacteria bacterium]